MARAMKPEIIPLSTDEEQPENISTWYRTKIASKFQAGCRNVGDRSQKWISKNPNVNKRVDEEH